VNADDVKGLGVVSIDSGKKLGAVDDLIFDTRHFHVAALRISSAGQTAVIPYDQIRAIGENAVTVPSEAAAHWGGSGADFASLPRLDDLKKLKVVDEAGTLLGTVERIDFMPEDGRVATVTVHRGGILGIGGHTYTIAAGEITSVGDEVMVVPAREAAQQ
jgi:sporulation protein YlmC with PRC-barrel domain